MLKYNSPSLWIQDELCDLLPTNRAWKGENSKFIVEKPDKHNLKQLIKLNITSD